MSDPIGATEVRRWQRPAVAAILLVTAVALFVATGIAEYTAPGGSGDISPGDVWWGATLAIPFPVVGYLIARRVPGNPIGWLFLAAPPLLALSSFLSGVVRHLGADTPAIIVYVATTAFFAGAAMLAGFGLLWFPTGRPPTPRWRWVAVVAAVGLTMFIVGSMTQDCVTWGIATPAAGELSPQACGDPSGPSYAEFEGPFELGQIGPAEIAELVAGIGFVAIALAFGAGIVSLVVRFRRAVGTERDQLRWPFVVVTILAALIAIGVAIELAGGSGGLLGDAAMQVASVGLPVSIGMAVMRYRLYDVDRVISRTVAYSIVGLLLAGLYGAVTVVPAVVLGSDTSAPPWLVALATLTAFVLFEPLRRRVQAVVDRRFNRARYDAQTIVERFSERVRDETDLARVTVGLGEVTDRVFQPRSVGVWVDAGHE
jgi:hypothetical protein